MTYYISRKEAQRIAFANPKLTLKSRYLVAHTGKYLNSSGKMLLVCKQ